MAEAIFPPLAAGDVFPVCTRSPHPPYRSTAADTPAARTRQAAARQAARLRRHFPAFRLFSSSVFFTASGRKLSGTSMFFVFSSNCVRISCSLLSISMPLSLLSRYLSTHSIFSSARFLLDRTVLAFSFSMAPISPLLYPPNTDRPITSCSSSSSTKNACRTSRARP